MLLRLTTATNLASNRAASIAVLSSVLLAGAACGGTPTEDAAQQDGHLDSPTNDYQVIGRIDPNQQIDVALEPNKEAVITLSVATASPINVRVKIADDSDIDLKIYGLFDASGHFGTLRAESTLIPKLGAWVFGLAPQQGDVGGNYVAVVKEKSGRAVPFTLTYAPTTAPDNTFMVFGSIRGETASDATAARASFDAACRRWKEEMLRLSLADVRYLDCGTPAQAFGAGPFSSHTTMVIASSKAFDKPTEVDETQLSAGSVDGWQTACENALAQSKQTHGDKFLAGGCGDADYVAISVPGVSTETITSTTQVFLLP
jgi:hypothetical protein